MRVGIVTQPLEMNYGGILQNWALQQMLKRLGHDPITIDAYQRFSTPHYLYNYYQAVKARLQGKKKVKFPRRYHGALRWKLFGKFVERHIDKTRVMWEYEPNVVKRYGIDAMVVGSDQVWRYGYNKGHIEDMFLGFTRDMNMRRLSYAASFGLDRWEYPQQVTEKCAALARQMDAISVREASGIDLCREHLGVEAQCVLDPTLLLDAQDYDQLIDTDSAGNEPYLAVYCLDINPVKRAFFDRLSQERGLTLRFFSAGKRSTISIESWLAMFKNATFVVTDSFHGTVFSILFGKEFYTLCNNRRGKTRMSGLLGQLGLMDRLLDDSLDESAAGQIDWPEVYKRLEEKRQESVDFLVKHLS